jgi:hypothetical protein
MESAMSWVSEFLVGLAGVSASIATTTISAAIFLILAHGVMLAHRELSRAR